MIDPRSTTVTIGDRSGVERHALPIRRYTQWDVALSPYACQVLVMAPRWSGRKRIMTILMVTALSCEDNRLAVHGVADGRDEAEDPAVRGEGRRGGETVRSEEHTSELQSP